MRLLIICLISFTCTGLLAQTKVIAFKSHSGNMANFKIALEENLFDIDNSNFGHAPQRDVKTAQLDSVIFVSDSVTFLVTSEFCKWQGQEEKDAKLWKPGKEKLINNPLFSRNHSLDSIKSVIAREYGFRNSVKQVVFVGYDNNKRKYKNKSLLPLFNPPNDNNPSPFGPQFIFIISLILVLSFLAAYITWKYYHWKEHKKENNFISTQSQG
jgi:hypothetical protein